MVESIVIRKLCSNGETFEVGDKVRIYVKPELTFGFSANVEKYVGTITSIYSDCFGLHYHNGQDDYWTKHMKVEDKPYNRTSFFFLSNVEDIERV